MKYTTDYFIRKFKKIPEKKWVTEVYEDKYGKRCALGHTGCVKTNSFRFTAESQALMKIFMPFGIGSVGNVNDGIGENAIGLGNSPQERVIVALTHIKEAGLHE